MTKNSVVVCDGDEQYVQAFTGYLAEHIPDIDIYFFTEESEYLNCEKNFDIGILGKDYLSITEFSKKESIREKFYLCDENIAAEYEHLPMVYKYQSMEIVEEMLKRLLRKEEESRWKGRKNRKTKIFGIYSPISHELSMPFGLSLCQVFREQGRVLFLDIEELSIMSDMTRQKSNNSLMDFMYMLLQEKMPSVEDYTNSFMGIDYLSPFTNPEEINDIREEQWNELMQQVLSAGYDTVVILFGRTIQGFRRMVLLCDELFVLGKPGDYYRMSQSRFLEFAKREYGETELKEVNLPMSAGNLVEGAYAMEELIQGNLGLFVRKLLQNNTPAQQDTSYRMRGQYESA